MSSGWTQGSTSAVQMQNVGASRIGGMQSQGGQMDPGPGYMMMMVPVVVPSGPGNAPHGDVQVSQQGHMDNSSRGVAGMPMWNTQMMQQGHMDNSSRGVAGMPMWNTQMMQQQMSMASGVTAVQGNNGCAAPMMQQVPHGVMQAPGVMYMPYQQTMNGWDASGNQAQGMSRRPMQQQQQPQQQLGSSFQVMPDRSAAAMFPGLDMARGQQRIDPKKGKKNPMQTMQKSGPADNAASGAGNDGFDDWCNARRTAPPAEKKVHTQASAQAQDEVPAAVPAAQTKSKGFPPSAATPGFPMSEDDMRNVDSVERGDELPIDHLGQNPAAGRKNKSGSVLNALNIEYLPPGQATQNLRGMERAAMERAGWPGTSPLAGASWHDASDAAVDGDIGPWKDSIQEDVNAGLPTRGAQTAPNSAVEKAVLNPGPTYDTASHSSPIVGTALNASVAPVPERSPGKLEPEPSAPLGDTGRWGPWGTVRQDTAPQQSQRAASEVPPFVSRAGGLAERNQPQQPGPLQRPIGAFNPQQPQLQPQPQMRGAGPDGFQQPEGKGPTLATPAVAKPQEEVKPPPAAHEFPSLSSAKGKGPKAPSKEKDLPKVEPEAPKASEAADTPAQKTAGTAWGRKPGEPKKAVDAPAAEQEKEDELEANDDEEDAHQGEEANEGEEAEEAEDEEEEDEAEGEEEKEDAKEADEEKVEEQDNSAVDKAAAQKMAPKPVDQPADAPKWGPKKQAQQQQAPSEQRQPPPAAAKQAPAQAKSTPKPKGKSEEEKKEEERKRQAAREEEARKKQAAREEEERRKQAAREEAERKKQEEEAERKRKMEAERKRLAEEEAERRRKAETAEPLPTEWFPTLGGPSKKGGAPAAPAPAPKPTWGKKAADAKAKPVAPQAAPAAASETSSVAAQEKPEEQKVTPEPPAAEEEKAEKEEAEADQEEVAPQEAPREKPKAAEEDKADVETEETREEVATEGTEETEEKKEDEPEVKEEALPEAPAQAKPTPKPKGKSEEEKKEEASKRQAAREEEARKKQAAREEEARKKQAAREEEERKKQAAREEEERRKQAAREEAERKRQEEEAENKRKLEEERKRKAEEEAERRRKAQTAEPLPTEWFPTLPGGPSKKGGAPAAPAPKPTWGKKAADAAPAAKAKPVAPQAAPATAPEASSVAAQEKPQKEPEEPKVVPQAPEPPAAEEKEEVEKEEEEEDQEEVAPQEAPREKPKAAEEDKVEVETEETWEEVATDDTKETEDKKEDEPEVKDEALSEDKDEKKEAKAVKEEKKEEKPPKKAAEPAPAITEAFFPTLGAATGKKKGGRPQPAPLAAETTSASAAKEPATPAAGTPLPQGSAWGRKSTNVVTPGPSKAAVVRSATAPLPSTSADAAPAGKAPAPAWGKRAVAEAPAAPQPEEDVAQLESETAKDEAAEEAEVVEEAAAQEEENEAEANEVEANEAEAEAPEDDKTAAADEDEFVDTIDEEEKKDEEEQDEGEEAGEGEVAEADVAEAEVAEAEEAAPEVEEPVPDDEEEEAEADEWEDKEEEEETEEAAAEPVEEEREQQEEAAVEAEEEKKEEEAEKEEDEEKAKKDVQIEAPAEEKEAVASAPAPEANLGDFFKKGNKKKLKSAASAVKLEEKKVEVKEEAPAPAVGPSEDKARRAQVEEAPAAKPKARTAGDELPSTCTPATSEDEPDRDSDNDAEDGEIMTLKTLAEFLRYRRVPRKVPRGLTSFTSEEDAGAWRPSASSSAPNDGRKEANASDRALFGTNRPAGRDRGDRGDRGDRDGDRDRRSERFERGGGGASASAALPKPSENAYKRTKETDELSRETSLKRCVQSLLNKICPENVQTIGQRIKAEAKVQNEVELGIVIGLVFKKALAEPHYCETYADLVYHLKSEMPEFPSEDGGKPVTFKSALLNVCQDEFDNMPQTLIATEEEINTLEKGELEWKRGQQKQRFLSNMRFIGNLFLRSLLTSKIIASIIQELIIGDMKETESVPEEHVIECVCELLNSIGYTLESVNKVGKDAMTLVCGRLGDLKARKKKDGKGVLSKRIQFGIQDVLDTRANGWQMKTFKKTAKTKEEVRQEQEREMKAKEAGKDVTSFNAETRVAGARPEYLGAPQGSSAPAADGAWEEVPSKTTKGRR